MARGVAVIMWSIVSFAWPQVGFGQGTIYTWVDGNGTLHYSDTPTGEARSIDDELPPAASFTTRPDSASQSETQPPALPTQGATADVAADAAEREAVFNQGEGEAEDSPFGRDEDFALGRDGPFGTDNSKAFED